MAMASRRDENLGTLCSGRCACADNRPSSLMMDADDAFGDVGAWMG